MKSILFLASVFAFQAFAGGLHFHKEYRGQFLGDQLIMQIEHGDTEEGPAYNVKLTNVPRHQTVPGQMKFVGYNSSEALFELRAENIPTKFKVVTVPPCAEIDSLVLIYPSGAQVLMKKN